MATSSYELPDTKIIDVGAERYKIPEAMFNPTIIEVSVTRTFFKPLKHFILIMHAPS